MALLQCQQSAKIASSFPITFPSLNLRSSSHYIIDNMKLITLSAIFLCLVPELVFAAPSKAGGEAGARRQVTQWQNQYNNYIEATVKTRKTGCTPQNIIYRREW